MNSFPQSVSLGIFLLAFSTSLAAQPNIDSLKTQQKQLQSLLNDIEETSQQRTQAHQQIKQLRHKLECNLALIRSYEICGRLHNNNPKEHLHCSSTAKRNAANCLSSDQPK